MPDPDTMTNTEKLTADIAAAIERDEKRLRAVRNDGDQAYYDGRINALKWVLDLLDE